MSFEFVKSSAPNEIKRDFPVPERIARLKAQRDAEIRNVITGKSDKFLAIIGPCSADNEAAVLDYTLRLKKVQEKIERYESNYYSTRIHKQTAYNRYRLQGNVTSAGPWRRSADLLGGGPGMPSAICTCDVLEQTELLHRR